MVGPDDGGAPGGAAVLPAGRQEAAAEEEAEEEDGERDGSRGLSRGSGGPAAGQERLLQRYLAALGPAAGGRRCPEKAANGAACAVGPRGRMTNGDAGFLLPGGPPPREEDEEEAAKLHNGGFLLCPPGPGVGTAAGTALEEPLRSCCLRGEAGGSPPSGPAAPPAFTDVSLNSRNTYEVSRRRSAPEHLPPAPEPPQEPVERARRAGIVGAGSSLAEFFSRYGRDCRPGPPPVPGPRLSPAGAARGVRR